jgi:hypothetical protein
VVQFGTRFLPLLMRNGACEKSYTPFLMGENTNAQIA